LIVFGLSLAVSSCAKKVIIPPSMPEKGRTVETGVPGKDLDDLSPHAQASLQLTEQGRSLLENGKANDAIRTLERAINLNPTNGLNYYYLSEAWLFKGKFKQAEEFNNLAEIYLEASPEWALRVRAQRGRIEALHK
jgi:tetratricopeptide (TPR) repeat protein